MKRFALGAIAFVALALGGLFTQTAQAQYPYGHRHHCGPSVGFYGGYGSYGYPGYAVARPYTGYYPGVVPYGAGYVGGWQPYQSLYVTRPGFSISFGY